MVFVMELVAQIVAAILILLAYAALQKGTMSTQSVVYLTLNIVGSVVLTALAALEAEWGFVLLEAAWAVISLWGLVRVLRAKTAFTH
jgi:hypothetical protein